MVPWFSLRAADAPLPELVVYTYDSWVAPGGLGPELLPRFEKICGCRVKTLPAGDGGQLLTRLELDHDRGHPVAQVVVGLDPPSFERARKWLDADGPAMDQSVLRPEVSRAISGKAGFVPYDFGYFALMADTQNRPGQVPPRKLRDLLKPEWKRNFILEDPRTSTPGLAFVLFADQTLGAEAVDAFWRGLRSQWLTLTPGWDQAYGLFLKKEAPLVWSYTTSQAYHELHGDHEARYRTVLFDEGQPMQIEGAALVQGAFPAGAPGEALRERARKFIQFLVSPEAQAQVALHNWMYPVRKDVRLPPSFEKLPLPVKALPSPADPGQVSAALKRWSRAVEGGG